MPEQLLEELARGLFAPSSDSSSIRYPLGEWASAVFGAASNVEVKVPGVGKASMGRRGARQLRNSMKGSESADE
jgi:hypothetical protein